jgi:hypothetical protein
LIARAGFLLKKRKMKQDKSKILEFCIDGWRHLLPLEAEIPRSTLYRAAKELCSEKLLVHRRTRGYRTTKRGIQALHEEGPQAEVVEKNTTKEEERGKVRKKPAVDLDAIQKFLQLPNKKVNLFFSLYPPLKKVPTPTHEAIIELILAEICDRTWPETEDHHLNFLNFGSTFTWKTSLAQFCAYITTGEVIPYILELSREGGLSLWVRKSSSGKIIFKREILERPLVCLDDLP